MPFGIVACTFSENLSRNCCIHRSTGGDTATVSANYCVVNIYMKKTLFGNRALPLPYYDLPVTKRKGTGIRAVAHTHSSLPRRGMGKGARVSE